GQGGLLAIQQRQDALPFVLGGRAQPAEVTHPLKACGHDMLEETMQETLRRQGSCTSQWRLPVVAHVRHSERTRGGGVLNRSQRRQRRQRRWIRASVFSVTCCWICRPGDPARPTVDGRGRLSWLKQN